MNNENIFVGQKIYVYSPFDTDAIIIQVVPDEQKCIRAISMDAIMWNDKLDKYVGEHLDAVPKVLHLAKDTFEIGWRKTHLELSKLGTISVRHDLMNIVEYFTNHHKIAKKCYEYIVHQHEKEINGSIRMLLHRLENNEIYDSDTKTMIEELMIVQYLMDLVQSIINPVSEYDDLPFITENNPMYLDYMDNTSK